MYTRMPTTSPNQNVNQLFQQVQDITDDDATNNAAPINNDALTALTDMTDAELASFYLQSQRVDLPNHLADRADPTQKFVYALGLNDKPDVRVGAAFDQYLADNGIPRSQVLVRGVSANSVTVNGVTLKLTAQQILNQTLYGQYNFIGGRYGGSAYGYGTYMAMVGAGNSSGYGNTRLEAVLSPNARVVGELNLYNQAHSFAKTHPQFAKAVGSISTTNSSIYALAMGYNVVVEGGTHAPRGGSGDYYVIIDRKALVARG